MASRLTTSWRKVAQLAKPLALVPVVPTALLEAQTVLATLTPVLILMALVLVVRPMTPKTWSVCAAIRPTSTQTHLQSSVMEPP